MGHPASFPLQNSGFIQRGRYAAWLAIRSAAPLSRLAIPTTSQRLSYLVFKFSNEVLYVSVH